MASYVNAGAYQQWNWNTNVQSINMDAVKHERDRQAFIASDMQRGSRRAPVSRSAALWEEIILPREARVRSYNTNLSPFVATIEGRQYRLPPVPKQRDIMMQPGELVDHFSGLGLTLPMALTYEAARDKVTDAIIRSEKARAKSQKKSFLGLGKKKSTTQEIPVVSYECLNDFFNQKLAEARIPLRVDLLTSEENPNSLADYYLSPSGESGNPQKELAEWAQKYWQGVPYKPWTDEIIEMPDSAIR